MEHGLILIIEAILAIDRKLQKPLREVIPELPRLRVQPRDVLDESEVIVGPRKAYAVACVLGAIVGMIVMVGFLVSALDVPRKQAPGASYFVAAGMCVLLAGAASTALLLHWFRGGSAVLRSEGVAFIYRGRTVFCPWALFQTPGTPYQPDHRRVILPANDGAPVAVSDVEGNVTARPAAEVKSRPLAACADGQVALADLYEVRLNEFGELLLHLGRRLGDGRVDVRPDRSPDAALVPLATAEPKGWLRIRLTRLPFPQVCCGCGGPTAEKQPITIDSTRAVQIAVPLCLSCQADLRGRRRRAVLLGVGLGLTPAALWLLAAGMFINASDLCIGAGLLLPIGVFVGLIGGLVARDRANPARFRDYSSTSGTVAMWLKPLPGGEAFRRALGVADAPPGEATARKSGHSDVYDR